MLLYVEVTHTVRSEMLTGIPRVVKNVVKNLIEIGVEQQITVVPIVFHRGSFVVARAESVIRSKRPPLERRQRWSKREAVRVLKKWGSLCLEKLRRKTTVSRLVRAAPEELHVLLLLDASWPYDIWPAVDSLREDGVRVISVIYDLIPVTHSATVVESLVRSFGRWLTHQARISDGVICISKTMANAVQEHLSKLVRLSGGDRAIPVLSFYLGAELEESAGGEAVQKKVLALRRVESAMFLMVGTIEPRKNHRDVFEAFKRLWADEVDARLIIVGREQWKSEELLAEMSRHGEMERRLVLIRNASDEDVKWLYENSTALIMASEVEGFGLPIVEARWAGLPVICSDIPVFREIAGPEVRAFRVGDVDDLVRVIGAQLKSEVKRTHGEGQWITWRESAEQLVEAIRALTE
jgi:alpha-1,2-rhamnosyltransferase